MVTRKVLKRVEREIGTAITLPDLLKEIEALEKSGVDISSMHLEGFSCDYDPYDPYATSCELKIIGIIIEPEDEYLKRVEASREKAKLAAAKRKQKLAEKKTRELEEERKRIELIQSEEYQMYQALHEKFKDI